MLPSDRDNIICTWAFLALTNFKLNILPVIKRRVVVAALDFGVMNEEILSAIFGCDKTKAFSRIEPLNCSFTHYLFLYPGGEQN
jgi:hypothetical protein